MNINISLGWQIGNIFAFGTHISYSRDSINFAISIGNIISSSDHNWYRFTLTRSKDDNGIYLLQEKLNSDNRYIVVTPKYRYTTSPTSITGFYFNGAGMRGQLTGDIRKFIFILGTDEYEQNLITYSNLKIE